MRVGFFTYGMGEKLTGIGRYAVELTRALKRLRPSLEIVLLNPYPDSKLEWYREFETYPVPSLAKAPLAATLGNVVLNQAARRLNLDVLHDPCGIAPFAWPAGRHKRVTTVHDAIPLVFPEVQPLLTRLIFRTLVPLSRYTADAVLTVSHHAAADIARHTPIPADKIHVTPNATTPPPPMTGAEVGEALERLGVKPPYFLAVGQLTVRKNLPRLMEAFSALSPQAPELSLAVVGPSNWKSHEVFAKASGMEKVALTGFVSDSDLHALYYGAEALVFPSLYEGFGLPALEAMAHGTPVVAADASSLPEIVGDAAVLFDPTSVPAITAALKQVWQNPDLRAQMRAKGLEQAKRYSWEETARKTLEVYEKLIANSKTM